MRIFIHTVVQARPCAVTISMTRYWSAGESADPVGRHRPRLKMSAQRPVLAETDTGECRLQVQGLPRRPRLDVVSLEGQSHSLSVRSEDLGIDQGAGQPEVRGADRRARHERNAGYVRKSCRVRGVGFAAGTPSALSSPRSCALPRAASRFDRR